MPDSVREPQHGQEEAGRREADAVVGPQERKQAGIHEEDADREEPPGGNDQEDLAVANCPDVDGRPSPFGPALHAT